MQTKPDIRQSMALLRWLLPLLLFLSFFSTSLFAASEPRLVNPRSHNAQLLQMRIRLSSHVHYCLAGKKKTALARKALEVILDRYPKFFATAKTPLLFAYAALDKVKEGTASSEKRARARRLLKKRKLLSLLDDKRFRKAVLIYVLKEKMLKKIAPHWQEAATIVAALRDTSEQHACAMVMTHLEKVIKSARAKGIELSGKVDETMLGKLKEYLPSGTGCPKTGKPDFTIEGTSVHCLHHGTVEDAQNYQSPIGAQKMAEYLKTNPVLWAFDHVLRSSGANAILANLRRKKSLGK